MGHLRWGMSMGWDMRACMVFGAGRPVPTGQKGEIPDKSSWMTSTVGTRETGYRFCVHFYVLIMFLKEHVATEFCFS